MACAMITPDMVNTTVQVATTSLLPMVGLVGVFIFFPEV
jgi:hypothetical protein